MSYATTRQLSLALQDLRAGIGRWRIWYAMGSAELRQRYRRSSLGPWWITLTLGVQAFVMGYLLSYLFGVDVNRQLPYICISLVTWTYISAATMEGCNSFIGLSGTILQIHRPLSTYVALTLWRNALIYLHTIVVFLAVAFAFKIYPSPIYALIPLGLALLVFNMGWIALIAGLVSTRFRDVPLLLTNLFTILVWLTPVYYEADQLGPKLRLVIELNPLTYVLEVARAPYLNHVPDLLTWLTALAIGIFGWLMAFAIFARTRARVPYWL